MDCNVLEIRANGEQVALHGSGDVKKGFAIVKLNDGVRFYDLRGAVVTPRRFTNWVKKEFSASHAISSHSILWPGDNYSS